MLPAAADPRLALPFFEFMLYGAKSFAIPGPDAPLACIARGHSQTLVETTGGNDERGAMNDERGAGSRTSGVDRSAFIVLRSKAQPYD